ncbi:hypothetical protein [Actinosynnema sp. NPDC023587]|uniref:hypothetical protein n=1 Tax=Actinosynnema sp. NPDC023587 TaxID=3154695 RepID=UPI00340BDD2C
MKNAPRAVACAVVLAVVLPGSAQAREPGPAGTVPVTGVVWFDRNANGVVDEGEPPLANGRAVRVFNGVTKEFIGEFGTDGTGRYRADVPGIPPAIYNHNTDVYRATTAPSFSPGTPGASEHLLLVDPETGHDVRAFREITVAGGQDVRVDARYFEAVHDAAAGPLVVTPDGPARLGDVLDVVVPLENRGNAPLRIGLEPVSRLEVTGVAGAVPWRGIWRTADDVPAGGRVAATVTVRLSEPLDELRFRVVVEEPDRDRGNDESAARIVVVVPPTSATSATSTSAPRGTWSTTAATTGTTGMTGVVPAEGGLAGTGAAPGLVTLIGGLLVGGGVVRGAQTSHLTRSEHCRD